MNTYLFKGTYTGTSTIVTKTITAPSYERAKEIFDKNHADGITLLNCRQVIEGRAVRYLKLFHPNGKEMLFSRWDIHTKLKS